MEEKSLKNRKAYMQQLADIHRTKAKEASYFVTNALQDPIMVKHEQEKIKHHTMLFNRNDSEANAYEDAIRILENETDITLGLKEANK